MLLKLLLLIQILIGPQGFFGVELNSETVLVSPYIDYKFAFQDDYVHNVCTVELSRLIQLAPLRLNQGMGNRLGGTAHQGIRASSLDLRAVEILTLSQW